MKIQEMKSGFSHFNKKSEAPNRNNLYEVKPPAADPIEVELPVVLSCELEDACWSVVSFDQREAGGLTYEKAATIAAELDRLGVKGLCIITDSAAARVNK